MPAPDEMARAVVTADRLARAKVVANTARAVPRHAADVKLTVRDAQGIVPEFSRFEFAYLDRDKNGVLTRGEFHSSKAIPIKRGLEFKKTDSNEDHKVTFEEAAVIAPDLQVRRFASLDKNKDGTLSAPELQVAETVGGPKTLKEIVRTADANGDRQMTFAESQMYPGITRARFDVFDTNKDGVITRYERSAQKAGDQGATSAEIVAALDADTNHDNRTTLRELRALRPKLSKSLFERLDANRDGAISGADRL